MQNVYAVDVEVQMQNLYQSLSEKDRRRYAAVEAKADSEFRKNEPTQCDAQLGQFNYVLPT